MPFATQKRDIHVPDAASDEARSQLRVRLDTNHGNTNSVPFFSKGTIVGPQAVEL